MSSKWASSIYSVIYGWHKIFYYTLQQAKGCTRIMAYNLPLTTIYLICCPYIPHLLTTYLCQRHLRSGEIFIRFCRVLLCNTLANWWWGYVVVITDITKYSHSYQMRDKLFCKLKSTPEISPHYADLEHNLSEYKKLLKKDYSTSQN